jgi:hypothetical protein
MKSVVKSILKMLPWTIIPIILMTMLILAPSKPFSDPDWQLIPTPNSSAEIIRMPVPHGWLVKYRNVSRGLVYIPDDKHEWKVGSALKSVPDVR